MAFKQAPNVGLLCFSVRILTTIVFFSAQDNYSAFLSADFSLKMFLWIFLESNTKGSTSYQS